MVKKAEPSFIQPFDYILPEPFREEIIERIIDNAISNILLREKNHHLQKKYRELEQNFKAVNKIGAALSSERNYDKLLTLILKKCREISSADAGSLYLVEKKNGKSFLRFKLAQNDTLSLESVLDQKLPLNKESLAGYVAVTGKALNIKDVYSIHHNSPYSFNKSFDEKTGYRTKSMIVVPMKNHLDEITGVLQLINRKRDFKKKLLRPEIIKREVIPFSKECQEVVNSLASQAAISIENNVLYKNIENLFEGFVKASVTAIEQRDPTTSGHSERVAILTVRLAEIINNLDRGKYKDIYFSDDEIKELRYATLLHDFGKVGVRENVLVKAKKLYPLEIEIIKQRFDYIKKSIEKDYAERKAEFFKKNPNKTESDFINRINYKMQKDIEQLDYYFNLIKQADEPTILPEENSAELAKLVNKKYVGADGKETTILSEREFHFLSIKKGSLTEEERKEIESHVTHTFNFLSKIPWTKELKGIPDIAYSHHEKLDGGGYPRGINYRQIPFQSRLITISDIYDALTAADRPYKKAVVVDKALDILLNEAKDKKLDLYLVRLFIDAKVYESVKDYKFKKII
ncbi:MAG: GAF domain-containing protein [Candidatus Schekmanbacteria bacterium]|nr:MAG: GAF domain-containing protein [Candidatus Schekmanbacteria bacterium]